jgi:hypothetical protein
VQRAAEIRAVVGGDECDGPQSCKKKEEVMKKFAIAVALLTLTLATTNALAETGTVLKWESQFCSQSAHVTRNHVVYTVKIGDSTFKFTRRRDKVEFTKGQMIECRVDKKNIYVTNDKGNEEKFDIIDTE